MRHKSLYTFAVLGAVLALASAGAQDIPAATRGDLEVGGTISIANPDLNGLIVGSNPPQNTTTQFIYGGSIYVNFNVTQHLGLTAQFDYPDVHTPQDFLEKSYMVGLRYYQPIGFTKFAPYAKVLVGLGNTSYDKPVNWVLVNGVPGSYTAAAVGAGLDYRWHPKWVIRAFDVQYEDWLGFPGGAIHPYIVSVGIAYRIR
ncbi:MAG: outer membrane beta-barrel protein [Bryocella sp.]